MLWVSLMGHRMKHCKLVIDDCFWKWPKNGRFVCKTLTVQRTQTSLLGSSSGILPKVVILSRFATETLYFLYCGCLSEFMSTWFIIKSLVSVLMPFRSRLSEITTKLYNYYIYLLLCQPVTRLQVDF